MKWIKKISIFAMILTLLCGCGQGDKTPEKLTADFMGPFDTQFRVIMYESDEAQFKEYVDYIQERFTYYNALYDKYNDYDGVANVKTINDNAGVAPVVVEDSLLNLIQMGIDDVQKYGGKVNVALGPVLEVWHTYRERNDGSVPSIEELQEKNQLADISKVKIDAENKTVYLEEKGMSLDVGATAKGYACELIKQELIDMGINNFLISAGGNVISYGKRAVQAKETELSGYLPDCRDYYTVDIESPKDGAYENINAITAITLHGESVVTSGDYQRYFIGNDGVQYHHLIDPDTLYPAHYCRSVTIITEDSGLADFLSSTTFLMPVDEGKAMIESLEGVEAVWLLNDGTITHTSGLVEGKNCHFYVQTVE